MKNDTNPFGYTLHESGEQAPCGRLVGYPASCGVERSKTAMLLRGRGSKAWFSVLLADGCAPGWQLAYSLAYPDNNEAADDLLQALRLDGLIKRGDLAHETSQQFFLSIMGGHGVHYRYNREYMWHLSPGAGNVIAALERLDGAS